MQKRVAVSMTEQRDNTRKLPRGSPDRCKSRDVNLDVQMPVHVARQTCTT